MGFYTGMVIMVLLALAVLSVLISENNRISHKKKRLFIMTNILLALSVTAECGAYHLNGNTHVPGALLVAFSTLDYILTPMSGGCFMLLFQKKKRAIPYLIGLFATHTVFEIVCAFTGWMTRVDDQNYLQHGPLFPVYMAFCILVVLILTFYLIQYGRSFRKQNRFSLYATIFLMLTGVALQELLGGELRVVYLGLTFGACFLFIHYSEFKQIRMDDQISDQQVKLSVDPLTGVYSRFEFISVMNSYSSKIPQDLVVFMVDINGLKIVNDSLGHLAGDELICGAAQCIQSALGKGEKTFRIGGDEFVVFASMAKEQADFALKELERETNAWKGTMVDHLSLSAGYALAKDYKGYPVEDLTKEADRAMYEKKKIYYAQYYSKEE